MVKVAKRAAVTSVLGFLGYFLIPVLALATPAWSWDGNGPRGTDSALSDAIFWTFMASFAVGAGAAVVAVVSAIIAAITARRRAVTRAV
jgi:ABC-type Fe3+ transport system permease subunit